MKAKKTTLKEKINKFLGGWSSFTMKPKPKNFWQYLLKYPLNYTWTGGSLLFIVLLVMGAMKYHSPILWMWSLVPFIMMVYNFVTEYIAYKKKKVNTFLVACLFYGACFLIVLTTIVMLFL